MKIFLMLSLAAFNVFAMDSYKDQVSYHLVKYCLEKNKKLHINCEIDKIKEGYFQLRTAFWVYKSDYNDGALKWYENSPSCQFPETMKRLILKEIDWYRKNHPLGSFFSQKLDNATICYTPDWEDGQGHVRCKTYFNQIDVDKMCQIEKQRHFECKNKGRKDDCGGWSVCKNVEK